MNIIYNNMSYTTSTIKNVDKQKELSYNTSQR